MDQCTLLLRQSFDLDGLLDHIFYFLPKNFKHVKCFVLGVDQIQQHHCTKFITNEIKYLLLPSEGT